MIEFDYEINRDEGDERVIFKPNKIPTKLDNLIYIEGPNSIGKSTLLNIFAVALFGLKLKYRKLHPALRNKMQNLINVEHQELKFKIKITDKDNTLQLIVEKPDAKRAEINFYEVVNGKKSPLSAEVFEDKYNLIYDIPHDPTDRIVQLTNEIKDAQNKYGNEVGNLKQFILKIISDIRSTKDPKSINAFKKQLGKLKDDTEILEKEITAFESELELLENSVYFKYYNYYKEKCSEIKAEIKELEKNLKGKFREQRETTGEIVSLSQLLIDQIREMDNTFTKVTELLSKLIPQKEKSHLNVWERINLHDCALNLEFDENLKFEIENFKGILKKLISKMGSDKSYQEAKMFQELIDVLVNYKKLNIDIPGLKKSITAFIADLQNSIRNRKQLLQFTENANEAIILLDELKEKQEIIENEFFKKIKELKKIKTKSSGYDQKDLSINRNILNLKEKLERCEEKSEFFEEEYVKKGKPNYNKICEMGKGELKKYFAYTEEQLLEEIKTLKKHITDKKSELNKNQWNIERLSKEIELLENKKPHEYQDYLKELDKLHDLVNILEGKLKNTFTNYINRIIQKDLDDSSKISDEQTKYNEAVFGYLGKRVGFILHLNKEYEVMTIDVVKEIITTKKGKKIWFSDMGTGQSQSAYLVGLLNTSDSRMVLALFDEVAMMDRKSLEPIYEKFRELYHNGRLLLGIVVQKAEEVNIVSKLGDENHGE